MVRRFSVRFSLRWSRRTTTSRGRMLGRVARAAHKSSASLIRRNVWRPQHIIVLQRCYVTPAMHPQTQDPDSNRPISLLEDADFAKHNLAKSELNIPLLRAYEMVREAEDVIIKQEDFDRAEAMLIGVLDFIQRNKLVDLWIKAAAQTNLGYVLHQKFEYQGALKHYSEGMHVLAKEPIKDRRFFAIRMLGYAECMSLADNNKAAEGICSVAASNLQKVLGPTDALVGLAYSNLASYMLMNGNAAKAVAPAERAFAILSQVLGKHNETTKNCAINLASIYRQLNKTDDLESLDAKFMTEDEPILTPEAGSYSPEYIATLKNKWRSQGPRKIFDPPGLHRSSELSAQSYKAFLKSWTAKMPITPASASVLMEDMRSLGYSFDKLPEYEKPQMPPDRPQKVKTGFEHLQLKGRTSFARLLDRQEIEMQTDIPTKDLQMTNDDWRGVLQRQKEYQRKHGDPLLEGELTEMEKSEKFFRMVNQPDQEELEVEESKQDEMQKMEAEMSKVFKYLGGHEKYDWDEDTYNVKGALHGDEEVQAFERSKTRDNPEGKIVPEEAEEEDDEYDPPDYNDANLRDLARFSKDKPAPTDRHQSGADFEDARVGTSKRSEDFGAGPSRRKASPKSSKESDPLPTKPTEGGEGEVQKSTQERENEIVVDGKESEKAEMTQQKQPEKQEKDPYAFNPEEDDAFPKKTQKDRSHDMTEPKKERKKLNKLKSSYARHEPDYKHGRLHEVGWHDDDA